MSLRIVRFSIVMLGLWLVIVVPWAWGDEAADQYAVAAGHYARGQWELAATEFGEFLRRFDADPRANQGRFFLAEALLQQGRPMEARKEFEEYLRRLPDGPHAKTARFRVGEAAYLAGRRKEARKDLEAFLAAYPDDLLNAYALPYLGDIALAEGNAGAAAEYYRRAIERFPSGPHAVRCRLGLGWALERLGEWDDADKQFDQVLASTSADRAWLDDAVLGKIQTALGLARLGQWDRAKSRIEPILAKHAGHPAAAPAVEQMAEAAYAAKNWPRAAEWFTWLAESSGQAVYVNRGLSGLAWTQFRQDHPADAAATFQRLLDRKPDPAVAARTAWARGYVLEQAGQHDAALASYRLALNAGEATPTTPMVLLAAARLHNKLKNYDEAAALYLRLATEYPKSAGLDAVLYEWSWALSDAGQAKEAADLLEQLHKEFPKTRYGTDAAYRLAEQAAADGDREAARRLV
ncbi:MAG TPA: tetratricopeptide repeat protein, partial [Thermoguttaceae bacterium]|nr:tetratricopeptide repeat protein [Thermoguttaceae bacterium]